MKCMNRGSSQSIHKRIALFPPSFFLGYILSSIFVLFKADWALWFGPIQPKLALRKVNLSDFFSFKKQKKRRRMNFGLSLHFLSLTLLRSLHLSFA